MSYCGCRRRRRPLTPPGVSLLFLLFGWTKLNGSQARSIPINITYELQFSSTGYVRGRRRKKKKKNLWFLTIFSAWMNSRFFCFSLSFGVGRSVFRSECVFLSKAVTQTISIDTQTREKKSGRAPYWFVSPFNNISVLIDTKEEKIRIFILSAETKEDKTLDNKPNISVG